MPNFDGGHYFLTALLPIGSPGGFVDDDGAVTSPVHLVRNALSVLPKARQSPSSDAHGLNSPFARSTRTHFARFVVIDDVAFNGRVPLNALRVAIDRARRDPRIHGPSDQLSSPYLLFCADFDAASGDEAELRGYLVELWRVMELELRSVLRHCHDFGRVKDADGFASYVIQGQIETTMPFNDYWADGAPFLPKPQAKPDAGSIPWAPLLGVIAVILLAPLAMAWTNVLLESHPWWSGVVKGLIGLAAALALLVLSIPLLARVDDAPSGEKVLTLAAAIVVAAMLYIAHQTSMALGGGDRAPTGIVNGLASLFAGIAVVGVAIAAVLAVLLRFVVRRSTVPFPAAPDSDLPSILKALYLQQRFQDFAIAAQGQSDGALHAAFGRFLADHKPGDLLKPTQDPGVVRS